MAKALLLTGISGSRVGQQTAVIGRSYVIGSGSACDLVLHDRQVVPRHAEIRMSLDRWFIVPLDPNAMIAVNGTRVTSQNRLVEGDLLTIGTVTFKAAIGEVQERSVGEGKR